MFAAHLNVTTQVVRKWECGEKQSRGPAAKLLTLAANMGSRLLHETVKGKRGFSGEPQFALLLDKHGEVSS